MIAQVKWNIQTLITQCSQMRQGRWFVPRETVEMSDFLKSRISILLLRYLGSLRNYLTLLFEGHIENPFTRKNEGNILLKTSWRAGPALPVEKIWKMKKYLNFFQPITYRANHECPQKISAQYIDIRMSCVII